MNKYRKELGQRGEKEASAYLERQGYRLLAQNYRFHRNEVDLVMEKEGELHFIEVKTRRNLLYGTPAEAITREKQKCIGRVAAVYMQREKKTGQALHLDVIEVMFEEGKFHVHHLKDAFEL